jgi:uncharacterized protein (TIGR00299 family) protein
MNETRHLYFDCFGGIAGDMVLASLIDLGLPLEVVKNAVEKLPLHGYAVRTEKIKRSSILATRFIVDVEEHHQPHRHFSDIRDMIAGSTLEDGVKTVAIRIFQVLAEAEARVHGSEVDHVHFHEVGAVDSIVDIVGCAAALNYFDAKVSASPVPLGNGLIKTAHGVLPVPAPATLFVLQGVPVIGTEISAELTTPTGAAIIKACAESFGPYPEMTVDKVGFGAGTRTHDTRPGLLRAALGTTSASSLSRPEGFACVIEANIDDMTGEIAGHVKKKLLDAGALDVWMEAVQMKKDRPAIKVGVLCPRGEVERLAAVLFRESPTIGLRYYSVGRLEMRRELHTVETPFGPIRVKVSKGLGETNAAPEFEDCKAAAEKSGVPVKQVMASAAGIAQKLIE